MEFILVMKNSTLQKIKKFSITGITAVAGGLLFMLLHIPVPWLLGPMAAMVVGTNALKCSFTWNPRLRNIGMMIIGYTIGMSMTAEALHGIVKQLPYMVILTVVLLLFCSAIAFFITKVSASDYNTSLLASVPGGLSQVLILAEETKGINLAVVTITQIIRLMLIIVTMPLLVLLPMFQGKGHPETADPMSDAALSNIFPSILVFILAAVIFTFIFIKIRFPTAVLLGPMVSTVLIQLAGLHGPPLPDAIIGAAQLLIGIHVGLMLNIADVPNKIRTISLAFVSGILLILGSICLSFVLTLLQPVSHATALLSLAPGGMDQMGIIAHETGASLSLVSGYQLFRTFFIYFAVPPTVKWIFTWRNNRRGHHS